MGSLKHLFLYTFYNFIKYPFFREVIKLLSIAHAISKRSRHENIKIHSTFNHKYWNFTFLVCVTIFFNIFQIPTFFNKNRAPLIIDTPH